MVRTMTVALVAISGLALGACEHGRSSDSTVEPVLQPKPTEQRTQTPQVPAPPAPASPAPTVR